MYTRANSKVWGIANTLLLASKISRKGRVSSMGVAARGSARKNSNTRRYLNCTREKSKALKMANVLLTGLENFKKMKGGSNGVKS